MTFFVCWFKYLIDNVYISLAFYFWHVFWHAVFSICFLAYIVCFKKHFVVVGISIALTLLRKHCRSLPEAVLVLTLKIQTRHSGSIRLQVHLDILETCYQRSKDLLRLNNWKIALRLVQSNGMKTTQRLCENSWLQIPILRFWIEFE